jgi:hypothetical protein
MYNFRYTVEPFDVSYKRGAYTSADGDYSEGTLQQRLHLSIDKAAKIDHFLEHTLHRATFMVLLKFAVSERFLVMSSSNVEHNLTLFFMVAILNIFVLFQNQSRRQNCLFGSILPQISNVPPMYHSFHLRRQTIMYAVHNIEKVCNKLFCISS